MAVLATEVSVCYESRSSIKVGWNVGCILSSERLVGLSFYLYMNVTLRQCLISNTEITHKYRPVYDRSASIKNILIIAYTHKMRFNY